MLMAMAEVSKDGSFKKIGDPRVLYATMMLIRTRIVFTMNLSMFAALKIGFRYASVRR